MEFWHDLITETSFTLLRELRAEHQFTLIGGWAVFLYTRALKSKDIDIIVDYEELGNLKRKYEMAKNERLKKYEIRQDGIDVDIYVPHFSDLGLPAEAVLKETVPMEGFQIPRPETLLILKQKAFQERSASPKGEKDKIDIFSLLEKTDIAWGRYKTLTNRHHLKDFPKNLRDMLNQTHSVKELGLHPHKLARLKKPLLKQLDLCLNA